jgi:tetratricopeptide (TPR) repeat protein
VAQARVSAARGISVSLLVLLFAASAPAQYVGSKVCRNCHVAKFASQSRTGHAHALAAAPPGSPGQWAFGAGAKAITYVSQVDPEWYMEHGKSNYASIKSMAPTPGHAGGQDIRFRTFDAGATTLRCFSCHSTGTLRLGAGDRIEPGEPGVHCESCHGAGAAHVRKPGRGSIRNPRQLNAAALNEFCGSCHRKPPEVGDEDDWSNSWNVRHQPSSLSRAACFRNSNGALSCLTCHDPHAPLSTVAAEYDKRCQGCHRSVRHQTAVEKQSCTRCHMPQVTTSAELRFTNHWIGIYDPASTLIPVRRAVKTLRPLPPVSHLKGDFLPPADPSRLRPLFEQALARREKELGPHHARTARAASDLGLLLKSTGEAAAAESPLRKAMAIDEANSDAALVSDRENLAAVLAALGRQDEAIALYRLCAVAGQAASGAQLAARCFSSLAVLDPARAESYYENAIKAEEVASGADHPRVAMLLNDLALVQRQKNQDSAAEPLFRRALAIEEKAHSPESLTAASIMINLGNLLQGAGQLADAERLERTALHIFEQKQGPESAQLSTACTNLADVLWSKGDRTGAEQLYRRAAWMDESIYGPDHPQVAGNLANLGMLLKESGTPSADSILRRALAIFVKSRGENSPEAAYVREALAGPRR